MHIVGFLTNSYFIYEIKSNGIFRIKLTIIHANIAKFIRRLKIHVLVKKRVESCRQEPM